MAQCGSLLPTLFPKESGTRSHFAKVVKGVTIGISGYVILYKHLENDDWPPQVRQIATDAALIGSGMVIMQAGVQAVGRNKKAPPPKDKDHKRSSQPDTVATQHTDLLAVSSATDDVLSTISTKNPFLTCDASGCRQVMKAEIAPQPFPGFNITKSINALTPYQARAFPNQRLKAAFGIHSCFTSEDKDVCREFRVGVDKLLSVEEGEWKNFVAAARTVVSKELRKDGEKKAVNLFRVVQITTLKTMMKVLWQRDADREDLDEDIRILAQRVNTQWLASKEKYDVLGDAPSWPLHKQKELQQAARAIFPDWSGKADDTNPFNLILPSFETMWRVVLRCFIEVTARPHHKTAGQWKYALLAFLNNPKLTQLKHRNDEDGLAVSAISISLEALRLYPPTRRVYREFQDSYGNKFQAAADIEALHRDSTYWDRQPELFNPHRWTDSHPRGVDDPNYMPFGAAPFMCPAKQQRGNSMPFGLSMLALLVGSLVEATDGKWRVVGGDFPNDGSPLDSSREAYDRAVLGVVEKDGEMEH